MLGPTFPNRQYLLTGQSEGRKANPKVKKHRLSIANGIFQAPTIIEHLDHANVPVGYYHTNVPLLALWGPDRMARYISSLDRYFEHAAAGRLPNVAFVEPRFGGGDRLRTDDHPRGDIGLGQRWVRAVVDAFVASPQWDRGALILVYDEGGGFFDHVAPPQFPDARASRNDLNNFGQGGFRVPAMLVSPYALPGAVDHRQYDHTSIARFLEWRFLGAPAEGRHGNARWALTLRDRTALNLGATFQSLRPDVEPGVNLDVRLPPVNPDCTPADLATHPPDLTPDPFAEPGLQELAATRFPGATYEPWLADVSV